MIEDPKWRPGMAEDVPEKWEAERDAAMDRQVEALRQRRIDAVAQKASAAYDDPWQKDAPPAVVEFAEEQNDGPGWCGTGRLDPNDFWGQGTGPSKDED